MDDTETLALNFLLRAATPHYEYTAGEVTLIWYAAKALGFHLNAPEFSWMKARDLDVFVHRLQ